MLKKIKKGKTMKKPEIPKITDFQFEIMLQRLDEAIAMKKSELSTIT